MFSLVFWKDGSLSLCRHHQHHSCQDLQHVPTEGKGKGGEGRGGDGMGSREGRGWDQGRGGVRGVLGVVSPALGCHSSGL